MNGIKSMDVSERPREKAYDLGLSSLSNAELLSIIIGTGTTEMSAIDLGRNMLNAVDNNISNLARKSIPELASLVKGVGVAKSTSIAAAFELGRRHTSSPMNFRQLQNSSQIADYFVPLLSDLNHEECWAVYLNRSNGIIAKQKISSGGISETVVDMRLIIKFAIEKFATAILLVHNHPSGNVLPSQVDIRLTNNLKSACKMFDISVLDHIIVGGSKYYSFVDHGML